MLYYSEIRLTFEHICFQVCVVIFRVVRWRHDPRLKRRVLFFGLWPCVFFLDLGHCPAVLRRPGESRWLFVKNILNSSFIFIYFDDIYKTEEFRIWKKASYMKTGRIILPETNVFTPWSKVSSPCAS